MGFVLNMVDLAMLNLIKNAAEHSVYNNTVIQFLHNNIFIISRVHKASAADTVDWVRLPVWSNQNLKKVCIYIQLPGWILAIKWAV